ncbi:MAG: FKBP-type peptidyl-prolyl cis-trans isomerase [Muribaculaceae bacterium]|nr:FKBP-type peptidyl-prolyl cis-trans isomerase [Muribaculaceae bacterium]
MRKFPYILIFGLVVLMCSCVKDSDTWSSYYEWRRANLDWLQEQMDKKNSDGTPYYEKVVPEWDSTAYVLMHYFNDRSLTENNLTPNYTSTVDVIYHGRLYNNEAFDSSYLQTDSVFNTTLSGVITGWQIALQAMKVKDSCEVIIPYESGYGYSGSGSIPPYSVLVFGMKLTDITALDKK